MAQTYDDAAALSSARSGVQKQIKEVPGNAHFVHCHAHQLNLILEKAVVQNTSVGSFLIAFLEFLFFSNSLQHMAVLEEIAQRRVPRPSSICWNFKSQTVNIVLEIRKELIECHFYFKTKQLFIHW